MSSVSCVLSLRPRNNPFRCRQCRGKSTSTGSAKLFEDAAREEAAEEEALRKASLAQRPESQHENWTGDEPMEHAVLRMLVDKYKPLRGGAIRTADDKLKKAPPQVHARDTPIDIAQDDRSPAVDASVVEEAPVRKYVPGEPLLPGIPGHQPWHTTFTVPSHATSSIRYGNIPPPKPAPPPMPSDERARRKEAETRKRMQQGVRLAQARESTLDYRLGIRGSAADQYRRPNPVSLKGWANLVEDRIERARQAGHFKHIKGRGAPIARTTEDKNPFIGREEFLMNRIVQRQGAAPPWVEVQGELETAVRTFREVVKQSWTRRAIRTLTHMHPAKFLPRLTLEEVGAMRDEEWEEKERAYHETALEEVNALVRKYNGLAPYAVRRAYYMRSVELERVYEEAGKDILQGLEERARESSGQQKRRRSGSRTNDEGEVADGGPLRLRDLFRDMLNAIRLR